MIQLTLPETVAVETLNKATEAMNFSSYAIRISLTMYQGFLVTAVR